MPHDREIAIEPRHRECQI